MVIRITLELSQIFVKCQIIILVSNFSREFHIACEVINLSILVEEGHLCKLGKVEVLVLNRGGTHLNIPYPAKQLSSPLPFKVKCLEMN